jgi:hypothetical protein
MVNDRGMRRKNRINILGGQHFWKEGGDKEVGVNKKGRKASLPVVSNNVTEG